VREPALRDRACKCLAWAAIGSGDARWAHVALAMLPSRELDVHLVASYLAVRKLDDQAIELLERARVEGQRSRETTKLLLDLLLLEGQQARAFDVARSDSALLASDEMALVAGRVFASTSRPNAQGAAREACADGGAKPVARR